MSDQRRVDAAEIGVDAHKIMVKSRDLILERKHVTNALVAFGIKAIHPINDLAQQIEELLIRNLVHRHHAVRVGASPSSRRRSMRSR